MAVDFETFQRWAEDHYDDVIVRGEEVIINSIFTEDTKHHLYCSPSGGKNEREDGCYHCWKSNRKGTLVGLVMMVDNVSYSEAKDILHGGTPIYELERRLDEFFAQKELQEAQPQKSNTRLKLPDETYLISDMARSSLNRMEAENYLERRKLPVDGLMYCIDGDYRNRIVIPYYDPEGRLIYFNSRHVGKSKLRYFGPHKSCGVGKSDVLYVPKWLKKGSKLYLTEGEFDALTLSACGFPGAACGGKLLSDKQLDMLKGYHICLSLDTDNAGFSGMLDMARKLIRNFAQVTYVRPPKKFKDWNKMLVDLNSGILQGYVKKWETPFDDYVTEFSLMAGPCL